MKSSLESVRQISRQKPAKASNQIHHILKYHRRYSGMRDNISCIGAYLVVAEVMGRLSASKRATQNFDMVRYDHRKLNVTEDAELYQTKFSNMFVTLESLDDDSNINIACIILRDIKKIPPESSSINYGLTKDVDNR
jgi:hypothetical protein